jgi:hypothetical protein
MTKSIDVIKSFINGESKGKTKNLRIEGDRLINHNTCIAERELVGNEYSFVLNMTKYSPSTSAIQRAVQRELYNEIEVMEIDGVPINSVGLMKQAHMY